jgi:hypothetical protein
MAGHARRPDAPERPYAPERFEYRIWGAAFPELPSPEPSAESAEVYFLPQHDGVNAKIRRNALEIKRLLGMRDGLQHWLPAFRCPLPLPAAVIADELCPALDVPPPRLGRKRYDLAQLTAEVAPALPRIVVVPLRKRRRQLEIDGARAERTQLTIGAHALESLAVEAEAFAAAARATERLGLRRAANLDYVRALRRILAGQPLQP